MPYTYFATDRASSNPPNFMWVTFKNGGALFITWDEGNTDLGCCTFAAGGNRRLAGRCISGRADRQGVSEAPVPCHASAMRLLPLDREIRHVNEVILE